MAAFSKEDQESFCVLLAAVDKETNESWDWFCGILFNDLKVGDGEGWVIISDQQKVLSTCCPLTECELYVMC